MDTEQPTYVEDGLMVGMVGITSGILDDIRFSFVIRPLEPSEPCRISMVQMDILLNMDIRLVYMNPTDSYG